MRVDHAAQQQTEALGMDWSEKLLCLGHPLSTSPFFTFLDWLNANNNRIEGGKVSLEVVVVCK